MVFELTANLGKIMLKQLVIKLYLHNEISLSKLDSSAILVHSISNLIVLLPFDGVESQILSKVKEETSVISSGIETCRPSMRSITTNYVSCILAIITTHIVVFFFSLHSHYDDICLSHKVLFIFKSF